MRKNALTLFFATLFLCLHLNVFAQEIYPPEPMASEDSTVDDSPCGSGTGGDGSTGVPPPVGLCLPINDYLLPLLVVGIFLGAWKVSRMEARL